MFFIIFYDIPSLQCSVCPPGYVDGEDGEGNVTNGSWREEEASSSMLAVAMTSSNRYN